MRVKTICWLIALLIAAVPVHLSAQLCNGSLGDPVVHIDFGRAGAPGSGVKAATTTYSYVAGDCPDDGFYTSNSSTTNCFNNTWHSLSEDHTPNDAGGFFMLVNASFVPGDFYVDTVRGLCTNTTYEFAAWVANVLKPGGFCGDGIDPNLTFSIETKTGTVLAKQHSGNIPEAGTVLWQQYGVFFKTPPAVTDVVVRITNNAPGGCGNDIALDDITFRPCGPPVKALISANGRDSAVMCEGGVLPLTMTANFPGGYTSPTFQWQESTDKGITWKDIPGAVNLDYTRPASVGIGSYLYKMLIAESSNFSIPSCRTASNTIRVDIFPLPVLSFSNVVNGCENQDFQLSVTGASTYNWTGPNGFTSTEAAVVFSPLKMFNAGQYQVTAASEHGCSSSGGTTLTVFPSVTALVNADVTICEGAVTNLSASGGIQYQWSPASGLSNPSIANPRAQPGDSTVYQVIVSNEHGCKDTATTSVNIWRKPVANAGPDRKSKKGTPVQLDGSVAGHDIMYYWSPATLSNPSSLAPMASPAQTTTYTLYAVSGVGCGTSTDDVTVRIYEIPNAFSPNGDGVNDAWNIRSPEAFDGATIEVYNRYGQVVFRSKGYSTPWNGTFNGKAVPVGTYYYVINLETTNEPNITGWIFVVR